MVPGELNLRALSVLDRDLFNQDFEADWKAHLEQLSDDQLREMLPKKVLCGIDDRVAPGARVLTRTSRRGLQESE